MKMKTLLGLFLLALPLCMSAQEDDAYYVPSKAKKKAEKEQLQRERQERIEAWEQEVAKRQNAASRDNEDDKLFVVEIDGEKVLMTLDELEALRAEMSGEELDGGEAPDYHTGALRDEDEYNRRPGTAGKKSLVVSDSIYFTGGAKSVMSSASKQPYYDDEYDLDFGYSGRLVRFYGGVRSPYYWDYYYDWAYDPWYRYGWAYDPWYYDYAFGWGYHSWYGRPWYGGYYGGWYGGLYGGWYDPWYHGYYGYAGWYDPWYHGYYYGYGGWHYGHGTGHGPGHNYAYTRPGSQGALYGGRRANSAGAGLSSSRAQRGVLAGTSAGRGATASTRNGSTSAVRGNGSYSIDRLGTNNGRLTTGSTRGGVITSVQQVQRGATQQSTNQRVQQNTTSRSTTTTQRSTTTTTSRSNNTYTPTTTTTSSRGGGFSTGSTTTSSGGSFGGGASAGRAGGGR